jgi:transposase
MYKKELKINQLGITPNELVKVMENCCRKDVCEHFNVSSRTLDRILHDYQLVKSNYGPKKLDKEVVQNIRNLYLNGCNQKHLAEKFNVSQSMISKIINNQAHKNIPNLSVSGNAEIKIGYKHGNQG